MLRYRTVQRPDVDEIKAFFEKVTDSEVAEVSIARDNTALVNLFIRRGNLIRQLEVVEDTMAQRMDQVSWTPRFF